MFRHDVEHSSAYGIPHFGSLDSYVMKLTVDDLRALLKQAPKVTTWWKHYKSGNLYQVINACVRESDAEICVLYIAKGAPDVVFCRPVKEWLEEVNPGIQRYTQED